MIEALVPLAVVLALVLGIVLGRVVDRSRQKALKPIDVEVDIDDNSGEYVDDIDDNSGEYVDPRTPEERAFVEQFSSEDEIPRLRRQRDEYFSLIERIEKERDALWKMYRESVSEHLNAQALLERHLMVARQQIGRTVVALNKRRKKDDLEPIKHPKDLLPYEGEPIGTATQFADGVIKLCDQFPEMLDQARPKMVDGKVERARVESDD